MGLNVELKRRRVQLLRACLLSRFAPTRASNAAHAAIAMQTVNQYCMTCGCNRSVSVDTVVMRHNVYAVKDHHIARLESLRD